MKRQNMSTWIEKINDLSENPCVCLCQCVCALLWLPFVIVYNLLKPVFNLLKYGYHLICCVGSKDAGDYGRSVGDYGGGIAEEVDVNLNSDRPLQFI